MTAMVTAFTTRSAASLAWLEFVALAAHAVPKIDPSQVTVEWDRATPIFDLNGTELMRRIPLSGESIEGFIDVASLPIFGNALLAIVTGQAWDELQLQAFVEKNGYAFDTSPKRPRFVAFRYPRVAVRVKKAAEHYFVLRDLETLASIGVSENELGDFDLGQGQSFIRSLPLRLKRRRKASYLAFARAVESRAGLSLEDLNASFAKSEAAAAAGPVTDVTGADVPLCGHGPAPDCLTEQSQYQPYKCVAACVQMMLDYRGIYETQPTLSVALQLTPLGLTPGMEGNIISVLGGNATLYHDSTKFWDILKAEVDAQRPALLLVASHAVMATGYRIETVQGAQPARGLTIYDPEGLGTGTNPPWQQFQASNFDYVVTWS